MLTPSATLFTWARQDRPFRTFQQSLFHLLARRWRSLKRRPLDPDRLLATAQSRRKGALVAKIRPGTRIRADYPTLRRH